jgi:hypothetical protein
MFPFLTVLVSEVTSQKRPVLEPPLTLSEEQLERVAGGVSAALTSAGQQPSVGTTWIGLKQAGT